MLFVLATVLCVLLAGGAYVVHAGAGNAATQKRIAALGKAEVRGAKPDPAVSRKRNMQTALKDFEKKQAEKKPQLTLRRRLDQAGLSNVSEKSFYIAQVLIALSALLFCVAEGQSYLVVILGTFAAGLGLPRWTLNILKGRREKRFTEDFANAIDVIVRSVKSGLPTNDALRIVAGEFRDPVGGEFKRLTENMKMGLTLEQALKKMYDSMPTSEVSFFGIVMSIQQKTGGNLAEALGNLAGVLRDRKRLQGKIKAMSSEAKASAWIIGSLPPGVGGIVYLTAPNYIMPLFTERMGNLLLVGCAIWMGIGISVMSKMINFKH
ncbi:tight adherence protein B [Rhizomicrobium palustre]|uniref:Tight adherence protein B n=1 Tax=Rhizomicrobium palustre TaxID=189966 RepID=A0A846MXL7_9PROT|nr:type II secretion system F family protein [Rhizomicrobium palustre]NIK87881.1 tight adherence protein B [Rhizomicrobium palustre]